MDQKNKAFTLIELLISTAIFATAIVLTASIFNYTIRRQSETTGYDLIATSGRSAIEMISRDMKNATGGFQSILEQDRYGFQVLEFDTTEDVLTNHNIVNKWTEPREPANGYIRLDGTDDSLTAVKSGSFASYEDFSVSLWFKNNDGTEPFRYIFRQGIDQSVIRINGNSNLDLIGWGTAQSGLANGTILLDTASWHHLVVTRKKDTLSGLNVYLDSVKIGTFPGGSTSITAGDISIGADGSRTSWYNGSIDELRVYNRELSASEVAVLNNKNTKYTADISGQIGVWHFDEVTSGNISPGESGGSEMRMINGPVFNATPDTLSVGDALQVHLEYGNQDIYRLYFAAKDSNGLYDLYVKQIGPGGNYITPASIAQALLASTPHRINDENTKLAGPVVFRVNHPSLRGILNTDRIFAGSSVLAKLGQPYADIEVSIRERKNPNVADQLKTRAVLRKPLF